MIKHGKILEHKVSLKIFAQKCSNDELGLILIFLWQDKICFPALGHMGRVYRTSKRSGCKS